MEEKREVKVYNVYKECPECGGYMEPTGKIYLTFPEKSKYELDLNSSRNWEKSE